jgi:outer membrane protein OmpA-like peptidoglycan-associated protein
MKLNKLVYLLVVALAFTGGVTGCRKKPGVTTPLPNPRGGGTGDNATDRVPAIDPNANPEGVPLPDIDPNDTSKWNQNRSELAANTVHFAYDSAAIRSSEQAHVEAVASYMKGSSGSALLIEGHCDERGTEEYNRALGERRALALRNELIKLGADGSKIVTRSFGKDRRIDTSESEAGHAKNRRGEFVVLTPK